MTTLIVAGSIFAYLLGWFLSAQMWLTRMMQTPVCSRGPGACNYRCSKDCKRPRGELYERDGFHVAGACSAALLWPVLVLPAIVMHTARRSDAELKAERAQLEKDIARLEAELSKEQGRGRR